MPPVCGKGQMSSHTLSIAVATVLVVLLAGLGAGPAWGQEAAGEGMLRYEHSLRFKTSEEALQFIRPLLSSRGSIEVGEDGRTLIILDGLAAQTRILPALSSFDLPKRPVNVGIQLVRAELLRGQQPNENSDAEIALAHRLRRFLPYSNYQLVEESAVNAKEGEDVAVNLGEAFRVEFRLGSVLGGTRLRLHGFRVVRRGAEVDDPLVQANLNLWLGRPFMLGLASSPESKRALMVIVECHTGSLPSHPGGEPARGEVTVESDEASEPRPALADSGDGN